MTTTLSETVPQQTLKEYEYNGKKVVRKYIRKTDKVYKPRYREPEANEVKKEYNYNGHKIIRYYKVKNANIERDLPGPCEGEGIQQN
jgi:hypothetical protein